MYIFIILFAIVIVIQAICLKKVLRKLQALRHEIYLLVQVIQRGEHHERSDM